MIDSKAIEAIESIIDNGDIAEVKLEHDRIVVVKLGKRKIVYRTPSE